MATLKILIVDDDEDFADGLMEVFELDGHEPAMAYTGQAAIAAVRDRRFDAVLIDIGLPDMSGAECLAEIRAINPGLPCFLLTGYSAKDVADRGIEAGAIEILTKPIDPGALSRRLAAMKQAGGGRRF